MPPPLALTLTIIFISFLFWRDSRSATKPSAALWLPVIWFFLIGSKFVSQWLTILGIPVGAASQEDGSPIDAVIFFALILAGVLVLGRRKVSLLQVASQNRWLTIFFVYSFLAIVWSDFPLVASKRWIKVLGHPIMTLIVLSDADPRHALRTVLKRSSYFLIPPSILFIKYFPQFGRGFDGWSGAAVNVGVMNTKNDLGYICALSGLFFSWNLMSAWQFDRAESKRGEIALSAGFLWMIWWLFSMADSATALACTIVGGVTMLLISTRLVSKRFIGTYLVTGLLIVVVAQATFGLYDNAVHLLGRNGTLTDRTAVWQDVIAMDDSPILGAGFESFWLGPRLERMWAKWWWHPIQAHNGYIETYLNLGWVGVVILVGWIVATFRKARAELLRDLDFGRFRMGVLFAIVIYNYTEATFKALHPLWTIFFLISMDYQPVDALASEQIDPVRRVPVAERKGLSVWSPAVPVPEWNTVQPRRSLR